MHDNNWVNKLSRGQEVLWEGENALVCGCDKLDDGSYIVTLYANCPGRTDTLICDANGQLMDVVLGGRCATNGTRSRGDIFEIDGV